MEKEIGSSWSISSLNSPSVAGKLNHTPDKPLLFQAISQVSYVWRPTGRAVSKFLQAGATTKQGKRIAQIGVLHQVYTLSCLMGRYVY
ncbi:hypothetical protein HRI_000124400 [Hibiscus trionum]|uniref:Uncharacterized protein n=1 Tax=Hibiscus trionum TaxID=183268 RepID=A0A9W7LHN8_HIBTR|nr:hypothetical protein HRI_000124400 [Hibiscus trionum]